MLPERKSFVPSMRGVRSLSTYTSLVRNVTRPNRRIRATVRYSYKELPEFMELPIVNDTPGEPIRTKRVPNPFLPRKGDGDTPPVEALVPQKSESSALTQPLNTDYLAQMRAQQAEIAEKTSELTFTRQELDLVRERLRMEQMEKRELQVQMAESQSRLQVKDVQLQAAFDMLLSATRERAELRDLLVSTQKELKRTQEELDSWSDGLYKLKTVIDSMDEDGMGLLTLGSGGYMNGTAPAESPSGPFPFDLPEKQLDMEAQAWEALQKLHRLSKTLVDDARKDTKIAKFSGVLDQSTDVR